MTKIIFKDHLDFTPNLTPSEIFKLGSFGGTYWRPIYSSVTKQNYENQHLEFPKSWWKDIPEDFLSSTKCNLKINKYKVKSGQALETWESSNWIKEQDPYGWVQWYCRFFKGRRSDDDLRQIRRWKSFAGPNGRFRKRLINMIKNQNKEYDDYNVGPVIRQGLQHWAYTLTKSDYENQLK
jgi:hypothetical protein